jgi:hypothetical protein
MGTTEKYTERESHFLNSAKEQKAIADGDKLDPFGPKLSLEPYRKPKLKLSQITEYIQENPGISRRQALSRIHVEHKREWEGERR